MSRSPLLYTSLVYILLAAYLLQACHGAASPPLSVNEDTKTRAARRPITKVNGSEVIDDYPKDDNRFTKVTTAVCRDIGSLLDGGDIVAGKVAFTLLRWEYGLLLTATKEIIAEKKKIITQMAALAKDASFLAPEVYQFLATALEDNDPDVRHAVIEAVAALMSTIPSRIGWMLTFQALQDLYSHNRTAAERALICYVQKTSAPSRTLEKLLPLLKDKNMDTYRAVANALAVLVDKAPDQRAPVHKALLARLQSPDPPTKLAALLALRYPALVSSAMLEYVTEAADSKDMDTRYAAMYALAGFRETSDSKIQSSVLKILCQKAANDSVIYVRCAALQTLGEPRNAIPKGKVPEVCTILGTTMGEIIIDAEGRYTAEDNARRDVIIAAIGLLPAVVTCQPAVIAPVITALCTATEDPEPSVRRTAAEAIETLIDIMAEEQPTNLPKQWCQQVRNALIHAKNDDRSDWSKTARDAIKKALQKLNEKFPSRRCTIS